MSVIAKTIAQRLLAGLLTLFVVSVIIFLAVEFLPGDFATSVLGQSATPETVAAFRHDLGLDQPAVLRYFAWIGGVLQGDFGQSFAGRTAVGGRDVITIIGPRLWNTFRLAGVTALIAVPLAIALGLLAALYRNSWFDRALNGVTLTTISVPEFFLAYLLMLFLAVKFQIFHSLSNITPGMTGWEILDRMILPALTLTLVTVAHMMRMTRATVIGVLALPYIEMAQLKGAAPWKVVLLHALPNAWAPIANVVAFSLAYLVVGVVVVEVVFVYPGIGQAMVDAVRSRDIPVVQACALIFAVTYILLNLLADLAAILTNPRLMHPR